MELGKGNIEDALRDKAVVHKHIKNIDIATNDGPFVGNAIEINA